ncbi:signal peptide peptidase SppA [Halosegnis marinus]|uniref:Signal peptide peptidase SppA n=1 Tax=Halosegnis marinus TaxID=3034023 RepID=A0ABD5ZPX9_9EURY|nr:signal peptide peptidase SppA [Halosegnis sp. DT85]
MNDTSDTVGRVVVLAVALVVAAVAGWLLFVEYPGNLADLLGVLLVLAALVAAVRLAGNLAASWFPDYNVAEVAVEGPITRDGGGGGLPTDPGGTGADAVVDQLDRANDDPNVEALVVKLNTPGGQVVPSDDIRLAAERFDGPTVAYATDVCASGGYWIASACDELWAREGSIVGSIGVRGSRFTATELLDKVGVSYEQFTAGEYKEAGVPFAEMEDDDREYLQGIIDGYYEEFVDVVAEGRGLDPEFVRSTDAKVYLGGEARDNGLVDELGTRDDVEAMLEDRLGTEVGVAEFSPAQGPLARLRGGAASLAYAFGRGVADTVDGDADFRL